MQIRDIRADEHQSFGSLLVDVYSRLDRFPSPAEQPAYYDMLANIGRFTTKPSVRVLVAASDTDELLGGVIYFGDMREYGSGGTATSERNACGIRLLAVRPEARGCGVGKALTLACIGIAREQRHHHVVLHTTDAMRVAWSMYENLGFRRATDLDFLQQDLRVYGFRLRLALRQDQREI